MIHRTQETDPHTHTQKSAKHDAVRRIHDHTLAYQRKLSSRFSGPVLGSSENRLTLHIQGRVDEVLAWRPVPGDTTSRISLEQCLAQVKFTFRVAWMRSLRGVQRPGTQRQEYR